MPSSEALTLTLTLALTLTLTLTRTRALALALALALTLTLALALALALTLTVTLSLTLTLTSKVSSELGGIVFICLSPYARPGGMTSRALPPTFISCSPSCHPWITEPSLNSVGSPRENDESKTVPSLSVPV